MTCGCRVGEYIPWEKHEPRQFTDKIIFCPTHQAAERMRTSLQAVIEACDASFNPEDAEKKAARFYAAVDHAKSVLASLPPAGEKEEI